MRRGSFKTRSRNQKSRPEVGKVSLGLVILDPIDTYTSDGLHFYFPVLYFSRNRGFSLQFLSSFFEFRMLRLRDLHATSAISVGISTVR